MEAERSRTGEGAGGERVAVAMSGVVVTGRSFREMYLMAGSGSHYQGTPCDFHAIPPGREGGFGENRGVTHQSVPFSQWRSVSQGWWREQAIEHCEWMIDAYRVWEINLTRDVLLFAHFALCPDGRTNRMLDRPRLLRISKQSIADLVAGTSADDIAAADSPADHNLNNGDMPRLKDRLTVRVRSGLTNSEIARFQEQRYRDELQFDSAKSVSEITDDSQRGQAAALAPA